jgi:hypothetical protein
MDSLVKRGDVSRTAPTTRSRSAGSPCCLTTASSSRVLNGPRMEKRVLSQPINRDCRPSRSPVIMRSFAAYGDSLLSADNGLDLASQLASSAILTGVAAVLAYFLSMREAAYQVRKTMRLPRILVSRQIFSPLTLPSQDRSNNQRPCPRCEGRRVEPCVCNRWSDGGADTVGCSSCNKSGMMPCRSCRGGGTAVPIKARIYVPSGGSSMNRNSMSNSAITHQEQSQALLSTPHPLAAASSPLQS